MKKLLYVFLVLLGISLLNINNVLGAGGSNPPVYIPSEKVIRVGVFHSNHYFHGGCDVTYFADELENYKWASGNDRYKFELSQITTTLDKTNKKWIFDNPLWYKNTYDDYDVIIIAGIHDSQIIGAICKNNENVNNMKENLENFIKNGGGYIGHCAGSVMFMENLEEPRTIAEKIVNDYKVIDDINIKSWTHYGWPIVSEHANLNALYFKNWRPLLRINRPEWIGALSNLEYCKYPFYGIPLHLDVRDKNHPILNDLYDNQLFFKLSGGPAFIVPHDNEYITNLADFNWKDDPYISDQTRFNAWSLQLEDIWDLLEEYIDVLLGNHPDGITIGDYLQKLTETYIGKIKDQFDIFIDWDYTTIPIETEHTNRSGLVAFDYPLGEKDGGRVVLCSLHPELDLWDRTDNYMKPVEDTYDNQLVWDKENLIDWKRKLGEENWSSLNTQDIIEDPNKWFIRREVAWASGLVPDDHLPPVYNESQIIDIDPILTDEEEIIIESTLQNTFSSSWDKNLSLFYRYNGSNSNNTWTNWSYYGSDYSFPWKNNFNFTEANGTGAYEFYSIFKGYLNSDPPTYINETEPPGADTFCYYNKTIIADFVYKPYTGYVDQTINFYNKSLTSDDTYITSYDWDFGDGSTSQLENPTHNYNSDGIFEVTFTVTNNLSVNATITKNITILNNHPKPEFYLSKYNVVIGDSITYYDHSTDNDGFIIDYLWDFGDGDSSSSQNPQHQYKKAGVYPVTLHITDSDKMTNSTCKTKCVVVNSFKIDGSIPVSDPANLIYKTIQEGINQASAGDIISIENGIYNENININKSIALMANNSLEVIINGKVIMSNPLDYELPNYCFNSTLINMSNNMLLYHCNNDSEVGENYCNSSLIFDYSGNTNNGTLSNVSLTNDTIKGSGAFEFNNSNDYIDIPDIIEGKSTITISLWAKANTTNSSTNTSLIEQIGTGNNVLHLYRSDKEKYVFILYNDDQNYSIITSNETYNDTDWHNIVTTYDGSSIKLYIDGYVANATICNLTGTIETSAGSSLVIGNNNNSSTWEGSIDEIAIFNESLTPKTIKYIYYENLGVYLGKCTINGSNDAGISPSNHSIIDECLITNHSIGISITNNKNVRIYSSNITTCSNGLIINNSNPHGNDLIRLIDSTIKNTTNGFIVNTSSNVTVIRSTINGSNSNITINQCNYNYIFIKDSSSPNNTRPDTPTLSGPMTGDPGIQYTYFSCTNDSNDDQLAYYFDWGDGNNSGWLGLYQSNITINSTYSWENEGGYYVKVKSRDIFENETEWVQLLFRTENLSPLINSISQTPETVGFGNNVTITVNSTDDMSSNYSGIKTIYTNITYPDSTYSNLSLSSIGNDTYQLNFTDTWQVGQYNYTIWAMDKAYNYNSSSGYSFNVSTQATMTVCTIKDSYNGNNNINITDPPNQQPIGYEYLEDNQVIHLWNTLDHYYFNATSGIQLTNHKDQYWSQNVLMLGYYNNDQWNLMYRTDELTGFTKEFDTDNTTYVNLTLWKNLKYAGHPFKLAIRYHLGLDDNELTVIPYIKNRGSYNPYDLAFGWELKDIQINMTTDGDYIDVNNTHYTLSDTLDESFTNLSKPIYIWNTSSNQTEIIGYTNPTFSIMEDITPDISESLYLRWDKDLTYKLRVKSRQDQTNAPVTLFIKIGTLASGQEKSTKMFWHDASQQTFYFDDYSEGEWEWVTNPGSMADGNLSRYASTDSANDIELLTSMSLTGEPVGSIQKVELRGYGYDEEGEGIIYLRPVFDGTDQGSDNSFGIISEAQWSEYFDITDDSQAPSSWSWSDVENLDCEVEAIDGTIWYCSKVEVRVTYNRNPTSGTPYPSNGATGVELTPLLNITVSDPDGDSLDISWISNSSGSLQQFGLNSSVSNGTYHQTFSNATENGKWWYWKVNASDDTTYVIGPTYSFYTGYQSKIKNTGSTNISGYLLMQIHYYNTTSTAWEDAYYVVNETTPRTINASDQFGLDTIFNGIVNSSELSSFGNGTYRVYAAFRDPYWNVLECDDSTKLEATYEFTITFD